MRGSVGRGRCRHLHTRQFQCRFGVGSTIQTVLDLNTTAGLSPREFGQFPCADATDGAVDPESIADSMRC